MYRYSKCTDTQKSLGVPVAVRLYSHDVKCHKKCEPKHGQRILSFEGNVIHFTITKIDKNTWETTAKNMNSLTSTSFQTTCIKSGDKLKVGFALENAADVKVLVRNENELPRSCPGNFKFTNIKFFNKDKQVNLVLDPTIDPRAMSCFSWFNIAIDNGFFGLSGKTNAVEFITKDPSHRDL
jgi:hypothetical protein